MNKSKWNFIIDVIMFLLMGAISGIGFLIKYTLIPGSERWIKYGRNVDLSFMGLDRHDWGKIHLILGFVLVGLLILHIVLHWKIVKCLYKKFISKKSVRMFWASILTLIVLFFIIIPFVVPINITERVSGDEHHHSITKLDKVLHEEKIFTEEEGKKKAILVDKKNNVDEMEHHHNIDPSIEVKGFMTLKEVSNNYKVPCDYIKNKLNIPQSSSNTSRLGHLKKQYSFKMSDLELIISNYKKGNK